MSKICNGCNTYENMTVVPFIVLESERERHSRERARLIMLVVVLAVALVATSTVLAAQLIDARECCENSAPKLEQAVAAVAPLMPLMCAVSEIVSVAKQAPLTRSTHVCVA